MRLCKGGVTSVKLELARLPDGNRNYYEHTEFYNGNLSSDWKCKMEDSNADILFSWYKKEMKTHTVLQRAAERRSNWVFEFPSFIVLAVLLFMDLTNHDSQQHLITLLYNPPQMRRVLQDITFCAFAEAASWVATHKCAASDHDWEAWMVLL